MIIKKKFFYENNIEKFQNWTDANFLKKSILVQKNKKRK